MKLNKLIIALKAALVLVALCPAATLMGQGKAENAATSCNGHACVDLGLPSGLKWADVNIGAKAPEDGGQYFAWGETKAKDMYDWSNHTLCQGSNACLTKYCDVDERGTKDGKSVLEPVDDVASVQWGGAWRIPTRAEFQELIDNCEWTWVEVNGKHGYQVKGKNGNSIFLPAAGWGFGKNVGFVDVNGYYWASTCYSHDHSSADYLHIYDEYKGVHEYGRCVGHSIRAVCK